MGRVFPYRFKENYASGTCVYRLWFGKKYFIWKGLALKQSVESVCTDLDRKMRKGCREDDMFAAVVAYILRSRVILCTVEMVCHTENHADLLDCERQLLKQSVGQPECLNTNLEPWVPKWINLTQNKASGATFDPGQPAVPEKVNTSPEPKKSTSAAKNKPASTPAIASDVEEKKNSILERLAKAMDGNV